VKVRAAHRREAENGMGGDTQRKEVHSVKKGRKSKQEGKSAGGGQYGAAEGHRTHHCSRGVDVVQRGVSGRYLADGARRAEVDGKVRY
jgi:hypothetical protein